MILNVGDQKTPQAMYYSGASAYPDRPSPELVRGLRKRGFVVYVLIDSGRGGADTLLKLKKDGLNKDIFVISLPPPATWESRHTYEI